MSVNQIDQLDRELDTILTSFDTNYAWNYGTVKAGLRDLYEKAKRDQWNSTTQLKWDTEVDPEGEIIPTAINPMAGYAPYEKLQIARRYLVPRQIKENGLDAERVAFDDEALGRVIRGYTREAGVRNLEREIGSICRGVAAKVARGLLDTENITPDKVTEYLGPIQFESETAMRTSLAGVVTGLAYTPAGGEIIHDGTQVHLGDVDLEPHPRFEEHYAALHHRITKRHGARCPERDLG